MQSICHVLICHVLSCFFTDSTMSSHLDMDSTSSPAVSSAEPLLIPRHHQHPHHHHGHRSGRRRPEPPSPDSQITAVSKSNGGGRPANLREVLGVENASAVARSPGRRRRPSRPHREQVTAERSTAAAAVPEVAEWRTSGLFHTESGMTKVKTFPYINFSLRIHFVGWGILYLINLLFRTRYYR